MTNKLLSFSGDVYSTNPEFEYEYANIKEPTTLPPGQQKLLISLRRRKMDDMFLTVITGFIGKRMDLLSIEQELQEVCRTCGSSKMYDIILVRDVRKRAYIYLRNKGFQVQFADS